MFIGLDIGGTKIESILYDAKINEVVQRDRKPTPKSDYSAFLTGVISAIDSMLKLSDGSTNTIGIGCCGSVDVLTGKMIGANILCLNDKNFLDDLRCHYPAFSIDIANDADCFALSEFLTGAASEAKSSCAAIIMGTGFGSGLIINGNLITGLNGLVGEIGHNPLPGYSVEKDGSKEVCYCGGTNCVESFCSGTGFERTYEAKYGKKMSSKDIFSMAQKGTCEEAHILLYADQVARVIGNLINHIDPEIIVLGGGMSNQTLLYPLINERVSQYTFHKKIKTPIVQACNGDSSGVIGAALLPVFREKGGLILKQELMSG
ncbi:MAG: ROK family protein [Vibrio sp.]|uniref:ROK family protein n=1 Tax=Vibrio sp. TaxID=678 RepID=UPI003A86B16A